MQQHTGNNGIEEGKGESRSQGSIICQGQSEGVAEIAKRVIKKRKRQHLDLSSNILMLQTSGAHSYNDSNAFIIPCVT